MSCSQRRPCGTPEPVLGSPSPPPGRRRLDRRPGDFDAFLADLVARVEQTRLGDAPLGRDWDVEGDPAGLTLARLWAFVAEGVAAYAELTANESYLPTASDWTDLRRIAGLVGYRPRPRVAARGYVRFDLDKGVSPTVPAGTRVQAPALPGVREAQTYEVAADAELRADWNALTATRVPRPAVPTGREMRFLEDPAFRAGDRVLFVHEKAGGSGSYVPLPPGAGWADFWFWLVYLWSWFVPAPEKTPIAIAVVEKRRTELGTVVVTFDRDLSKLLPSTNEPYAVYRVADTAGSARRISKVVRVPVDPGTTTSDVVTVAGFAEPDAKTATSVVLDAALDDLSAERLVAVVDWSRSGCDIRSVSKHELVEWEVSPGVSARVSKVTFDGDVPTLQAASGGVTVYVLDARRVASHYVFPEELQLGEPAVRQLRLFPAPTDPPARVAVRTEHAEGPVWEVFACRAAADGLQEKAEPGSSADAGERRGDEARGLVVDLLDAAVVGVVRRSPASGNVVEVRHGATQRGALGGGTGLPGQRIPVPKAPVAYDLGPDGGPVPTLQLRVDGVRWDEVASLYGVAGEPVFAARLDAAGGVTAEFVTPVPSGRGNVTATYRVGGGTAGELPSGAIDSLVGSLRGVKGVGGVGPVAGGADQDDELRLRALAPTRARAFHRAVSRDDLTDLALAFPGVGHAAAWAGAGPPGCGCGGAGLHVAFVRTGPKAPLPSEVQDLATYLGARRDPSVPLCVAAGVVTEVDVTATVAYDPRLEAGRVLADVEAALRDGEGALSPDVRLLGQPLDRSDVLALVHRARGVVGVPTLTLSGPSVGGLGRRPAERHELLAAGALTLTAVTA